MKTAVYVDGYNLYYGRLKHTIYKWLNLHALISKILHQQDPDSSIISCRYYTAMVKARLARHGSQSVQAQCVYHQALESCYGPRVEVIKNLHVLDDKPLMRFVPGQPPNKEDTVRVWRLEEKQTDVRIALDAYRAAIGRTVEQIVIVSNDTDLVPLLETLKYDAPHVRRGAIIPRHESSPRRPAQDIINLCHWTRRHILDEELASCQFPERVATRKKPAIKPYYW